MNEKKLMTGLCVLMHLDIKNMVRAVYGPFNNTEEAWDYDEQNRPPDGMISRVHPVAAP